MALHRRSPRTLAQALAPLQRSLAPTTLLAEVQAAWTGVVGDVVAAEASPVSERAGTLTVSCRASVWAHELELMSEDITTGLNAVLSTGRITDLRCRVEGA
jgi:predicted nucleic acid-binding Zn ribbon protein